MSRALEVGQQVRCNLPGRRSFETTVIALRETELAVDVKDPRNGGLRTLRVEHVRPVPRRRKPRA